MWSKNSTFALINSRWVPFNPKFRFANVYRNFRMPNGTIFSSTPDRSSAISAWGHFQPILTQQSVEE